MASYSPLRHNLFFAAIIVLVGLGTTVPTEAAVVIARPSPEFDYYDKSFAHCKFTAKLEETKDGRIFLNTSLTTDGCDGAAIEVHMERCENPESGMNRIDYMGKLMELCPRWTGCTKVSIMNFEELVFKDVTSHYGKPKVTQEDIGIQFNKRNESQRLQVTVRGSERISLVRLDVCFGQGSRDCPCPRDLFPASGNLTGSQWVFDFDGSKFVDGCDYYIFGRFLNSCEDHFPLPTIKFSGNL